MRLSPMGSCLNTWSLLVELFGKDSKCGLIGKDMPLGVGFEDSEPIIHSLLAFPLPHACGSRRELSAPTPVLFYIGNP